MDISSSNINEKTKIVIADDYCLIREAIRSRIEKEKDLEVVAETGDGKEAVDICVKLSPDVIIMDYDMPVLNGIEATRQIAERCLNTETLILTDHDDSIHVIEILNSGAAGYLTKWVSSEVIVHFVRKIASGGHAFPSTDIKDPSRNAIYSLEQIFPRKSDGLNAREMTILRLIARGMSNKDIALRLGLSLNYIKANLTTIFVKLGVSSRTEAITNSLRANIISLKDLEKDSYDISDDFVLREKNE